MNQDKLYDEALKEITCHAMLHTFMKIQYKDGFTPYHERNDILIKYLKEKQHLSKFKSCKKEIKTMLFFAREGGDLLAILSDINHISINW
ncbi:DUF2913 family protein [Moritella viscosa]|uniref:Uncharacterized protein n=1 Tax=Moritella viscosa TaxID=80854 RepID=A0A1L0A7B7_9GAMM|nr:DUF2913 family protein [Moritella viscosa]SGY95074.1 Putative uncharacterized protein [Moritella viscosa]SGZ00314.1 Putative uncharacterized protein [Moritella viscosa]SGZ00734.1 Putative uncharacterized protein [Moritella viscosa]SGZ06766.1 Putative uncharacterized protein [Moritella viscosa]SGZ06964.1 Putative uncharacterized protein [Moritella viscosa]